MRHIPKARKGSRLLDVGSGDGSFLSRARGAGWDVVGVEPDPQAWAISRQAGLDVRHGGVECVSGERESFDVITMNHVIEHVRDPRQELLQAYALLKPAGLLYLETPNIESRGHEHFGPHWYALDPPRHLVPLNWTSLESLLASVGFGTIRRFPRRDVSSDLATKSRSIERGEDPEIPRAPSIADRLAATLTATHNAIDYRRSDFVTLIAQKP